jgi:LCP family protein required for cell wall assembly
MRRRRIGIVLGSLAVILALIAGTGLVYYNNLKNSFDSKAQTIPNAFPTGSRPAVAANGSVNILLLGSDKRAQAVDPTIAVPGGGADERTDSIMLVNISGDRKHVTVLSVMRDLWVDIPGHGKAKINAGYAYGGRQLEIATIEQFLQTRIDHVALVDMESFKEFGDSLGGLDVTVEKRTVLESGTFEPGVNHLNGTQALAFSRERKQYATGDYQRVRNQQAVLRAIMNKLLSKDTLTNPNRIQDVIDKTSPYISVDDSFNFSEISKLGVSLRSLKTSDVTFATVPTAGVGWSADGQSIVLVDEKNMPALRTALKDDKLAEWTTSSGNHENG